MKYSTTLSGIEPATFRRHRVPPSDTENIVKQDTTLKLEVHQSNSEKKSGDLLPVLINFIFSTESKSSWILDPLSWDR